MQSEREIWACALHLVKCRGLAAEAHATQRAIELLEDGDLTGYRRWSSITDHIRRLNSRGLDELSH